MHWWGLLGVELPSSPGVSGITVLSAVSFTESLPFPGGGAAFVINVFLKQSDVLVLVEGLFLEAGHLLWAVC